MSDDVLAKAKERKDVLAASISQKKAQILDAQSMISRFEKEMADLDAWISMWHILTGTPANPQALERIENVLATPKSTRAKNPDRDVVVSVSLDLIHKARRPLTRKELFDALAENGIEINGKNPEMVLSTMLWRSSDRIVRLPNFGYWPKEIEFREASYSPIFDEIFEIAAKEPEDGYEEDYEE